MNNSMTFILCLIYLWVGVCIVHVFLHVFGVCLLHDGLFLDCCKIL